MATFMEIAMPNTVAKDKFDLFLEALAQAMDCGLLAPEKDGRVLFGLDGNMGVVIERGDAEEFGREVAIVSVLVGRPDLRDAELLGELLMGNYMWAASGEGTLAIDRDTGILVLHKALDLTVAPEALVDIFASMASAARYWQPRLENAGVQGDDITADAMRIRV